MRRTTHTDRTPKPVTFVLPDRKPAKLLFRWNKMIVKRFSTGTFLFVFFLLWSLSDVKPDMRQVKLDKKFTTSGMASHEDFFFLLLRLLLLALLLTPISASGWVLLCTFFYFIRKVVRDTELDGFVPGIKLKKSKFWTRNGATE